MTSHPEGPRYPDDQQGRYGAGEPSDAPEPGQQQQPYGHNPYQGQNTQPGGYGAYGTPGYGEQQYPGYGEQQYPGYGEQQYYQQPPPYQQPQQPYGYGYGYAQPPRHPDADGKRTHAIVALVISIVLAMSCYVTPGGLAASVLSGIALSKADLEPQKAGNLLKWAWISIGINVGLIILGVATIIFLGATGNLD
ncbi:hypothetical protein GCM10023259_073550 [Thermocatellispora tengchongensis]